MIDIDDKILVTGGTGFLGNYILTALLSAGYSNITVISSKPVQQEGSIQGIRYRQCDILDIPLLSDILDEIDVVIHAAAFISFKKKDYKKLLSVNVNGTENITNLGIEKGIKKIIYISSTAALPLQDGNALISEDQRFADRNFLSTYGMSKYMAESHIWRADAEGLDICVLNPSLILGAGNWEKGTPGFFKRIHEGLNYYPTGANGIVYAKDVAVFIVQLLEKGHLHKQYILSSENIMYEELFRRIAKALSKSAPTKAIEGIHLILARMIDFFNRLVGRESYLDSEGIKNIKAKRYYDNSRSLEEHNFNYTDSETMMNDIAQAYLIQEKAAIN